MLFSILASIHEPSNNSDIDVAEEKHTNSVNLDVHLSLEPLSSMEALNKISVRQGKQAAFHS